MKITVVGLSMLLGEAAAASTVSAITTANNNNNNNQKWTPVRVTYDDLVRRAAAAAAAKSSGDADADADADVVWDALKTTGMVSITNVPGLNKKMTLKDFEKCVGVGDDDNHNSKEIMTHTFDDGTVRQTIATSTVNGGGEASDNSNNDDNNKMENCNDFQDSSTGFRSAVQKVTAAVAKVIGQHSSTIDGGGGGGGGGGGDGDSTGGSPPLILQDSIDESKTYDVESIIVEGEHLEHFHAYYSTSSSSSGDEYETIEDKEEEEIGEDEDSATTTNTIDWHTDQGIFLLFTPGQYNNKGCHRQDQGATATDGLFVQLGDNQPPREVEFDAQVDDLVLMLGDGVYQYVNPYLPEDEEQLTSVSHALKLGHHDQHSHLKSSKTQKRVWYGRMVLPPPTAIHPRSPSKRTVAEVRMGMIHKDTESLLLGCSSAVSKSSSPLGDSNDHQAVAVARELTDNATICNEETSAFCWHRCMNYTDYDGVNEAVCGERSLSLGCVNPDGYLWTGKHDMTFGLGCVNLSIAENVTYPDEEEDNDGHSGGDGTHNNTGSNPPSGASSSTLAATTSLVVAAVITMSGMW
eukprot:CAMPEP_0113465690 /NCGR_PEP_ID=MMETSP0014_2-20120614/13876_1 /TAXON_ID=2857 /ORGANISM="Nitzschia sp." /LENGTH=576 /DNA_ID=CAMNT_0000357869 /DNA_START=285 /DNA_END=2015 /DNA_ORIENTATION=+ /assembly_acc=CAM_ASM_000159